MDKFFSEPRFVQYFQATDRFGIANLGYDDFHVVRAIHTFHTQSNCTLHFILHGSGTLELGDRVFRLHEGMMFFTPSDTEMRYYPDPEDPWDYIWFSLSDTAGCRELLGFTMESPTLPIPHFSRVKSIFKRMLDALAAKEIGHFGAMSALYEALDICAAPAPPRGIHAVKALIDDNFTVPSFRVETLCRDAGLSHAHLLRLFKAEYGTTVQQYVTTRRIALAKELLYFTDLSVGSVAISCGFADETHFMKTFKKITGLSALAYRKTR